MKTPFTLRIRPSFALRFLILVQFVILIAIAFYFFYLKQHILSLVVIAIPIICIWRNFSVGYFDHLTQAFQFQFCSDAKLILRAVGAGNQIVWERSCVISYASRVYEYLVILILKDDGGKCIYLPLLFDALSKEEFRLLKNHIFYAVSKTSSNLA
ncbi:protein YgfX [Undibacterium cyanobacteriorum]|uniref:protein YgfX n=1 Tax=Undibacterium cyanobacteriorum TaxID=3073561 RepID=UPI0035A34CA4